MSELPAATAPPARNSVAGLRCLRCGALYPPDHFVADCPACRSVAPSNLAVEYRGDVLNGVSKQSLASGPRSIWRYAHSLPVAAEHGVSLGEGLTPLVELPRLARQLDLGSLHAKCEFANPTGSFKDRLASVAVSAGRVMFGARVIASSSSGNAGAAAAAYAARAGLPCIIFTFLGTAGPMVTQMQAYGAMVVGVEDKAHRWTLLEAGVRRFGWFPTSPFFGPVVGSNPYGIEGYKSLAYEIAEQLGWRVPDWIVLPVCYGDALVGMARGFAELLRLNWIKRMPRLVAAEIYGSLSRPSRSSATTRRPFRAPMTRSPSRSARAEHIPGAESGARDRRRRHARAGRRAAALAPRSRAQGGAVRGAVRRGLDRRGRPVAAPGHDPPGEAVTCLITSGGLKDPATAAKSIAPIPTVPPDLDRVLDVVAQVYGVDATRLSSPQGERGST